MYVNSRKRLSLLDMWTIPTTKSKIEFRKRRCHFHLSPPSRYVCLVTTVTILYYFFPGTAVELKTSGILSSCESVLRKHEWHVTYCNMKMSHKELSDIFKKLKMNYTYSTRLGYTEVLHSKPHGINTLPSSDSSFSVPFKSFLVIEALVLCNRRISDCTSLTISNASFLSRKEFLVF